MHLAFLPLSVVHLAVGIGELALAAHLAVLEVALVHVTSLQRDRPINASTQTAKISGVFSQQLIPESETTTRSRLCFRQAFFHGAAVLLFTNLAGVPSFSVVLSAFVAFSDVGPVLHRLLPADHAHVRVRVVTVLLHRVQRLVFVFVWVFFCCCIDKAKESGAGRKVGRLVC